ncbi:MAG: preprotein translocase subunit SecG [Oscillospiraceae bacterium]
MSPLMIFLTVIYVVFCLFLIAVVLLQSGKSAGLGAISGGMDTFLSKNKAKTWDVRLAKITKWVAVAFMALTLVLVLFL